MIANELFQIVKIILKYLPRILKWPSHFLNKLDCYPIWELSVLWLIFMKNHANTTVLAYAHIFMQCILIKNLILCWNFILADMFLMSIYSGEYVRYRCWYTTSWNSYSQSYQHTAYLYCGIPLPRHARNMTSTGNMIMLIIMQYMQYKLCQHTTYFYYVNMRQNISMSTFNIIILTCAIIMSICEVIILTCKIIIFHVHM